MKRFFITLTLLTALSGFCFGGGFYIDAGPSLNYVYYGNSVNSFIDNYYSNYGLTRTSWGASLSSGYRLLPSLYLTGSGSFTSDVLSGFGYNIDLFTPAAMAGVRWYPLSTHKYLQLGLDAGPSWFLFSTDIPGISDVTDIGIGVNVSVAFDLNQTYNGPGLMLGANALYTFVGKGSVLSSGVFVKITYKRTWGMDEYEKKDDMNDKRMSSFFLWPVIGAIAAWVGYNTIDSAGRS
jgi:hypothetical protein